MFNFIVFYCQGKPLRRFVDTIGRYWLAAAEKTLEVVRFPERRNVELRMIHSSRVPTATMKAKFHFQEGQMRIDVSYTKMKPAVLFGGEITSFVLWAVSRDGKAENLGELWVRPEKPDDTLRFSTGLRTFALMVTAEPYYQIDKPSDSLIFWNAGSQDPQAASSPISFTDLGEPSQMGIERLDFVKYDGKTPLDVLQAEKTYEMAERMKAGDYASALMGDAMTTLQQARQMARSSSSRRGARDYARRSVASSNEAIRITLRKLEAEQLDAEIQQRRAEIDQLENRAREAEDRAREVQEEADRQVASLESQKSAAEERRTESRIMHRGGPYPTDNHRPRTRRAVFVVAPRFARPVPAAKASLAHYSTSRSDLHIGGPHPLRRSRWAPDPLSRVSSRQDVRAARP